MKIQVREREKISDYSMYTSFVCRHQHIWIMDALTCVSLRSCAFSRAEILSMCPKEFNNINQRF